MSKKNTAARAASACVGPTLASFERSAGDRLTGQTSIDRSQPSERGLCSRTAEKYRAIGFRLNNKGFPIPDHPSTEAGKILLLKSLGIDDPKLYGLVVQQLINAASRKQFDLNAMNEMLGLAQSIGPRDQLEAMLALQMAAVHCKSMRFLSKIDRARTLEEHETYERTANKLLRTFGCQAEALRKHRNGGNQSVFVKHVHVHDGGQALVGNVSRRVDD